MSAGHLGPFRRKVASLLGLLAVLLPAAPVTASAETGPVRSLLSARHENVVIQRRDLSCGAAALTTLLRYQHGLAIEEREVALALMQQPEYLADPAIVQRQEGFSLLDLQRFVVSRGFRGVGYSNADLAGLLSITPAIVPIEVDGYNHFVVFRGMMGDRVLLANPAYGNQTMSRDQFMKRWLTFEGLGRVAFMVTKGKGPTPPGRLAPRAEEFVMLR